ncbi:g2939 [Coccomyxa viridis]|uniref:G2939 protein n=1 Tax=Coccomyxa viridis TaxID=1274662 RepID=A0ABP1FLL1_9CHLO
MDHESCTSQHAAPCYRVRETPYTGEAKARGVFAARSIRRGELVETAHCIYISKQEYDQHMRHTVLEHYLFSSRGEYFLALGVGSLFNHSCRPCLDYRVLRDQLVITYTAARDIQEGEELTITYGKIWFEDQSLKTRTDEDDPVHHHMDDPDGFLAALAL